MIVVAVIAILSGIAYLNIQSYRNKAQKFACITNLREIENYICLWAINNGKTKDAQVRIGNLVPAYIKSTPYCPVDSAKQEYILSTVSEKPICPVDPENHYIE